METSLMGRVLDSMLPCFSQSLLDNWMKPSPGRQVIPQLPAAYFLCHHLLLAQSRWDSWTMAMIQSGKT